MEMTRLQCYFGFLFYKSYEHLVEKLNGHKKLSLCSARLLLAKGSTAQEIPSACIVLAACQTPC